MRRTIHGHRSHWTSDLPAETPSNVEDSRCVSCHVALTIQGKWGVWHKLSKTPTWTSQWRRSVWGREYPQASKAREKLSVLCEMERVSHFWGIMGTGRCILWWWWPADTIQRATKTLKSTMLLPHGLSWTVDNSWLLSCGAQVEIWSPSQPNMGNIQWTRGHKWSPWIRCLSQTSPRIRSSPNNLKESQDAPPWTRHHRSDRSTLFCAMTNLSPLVIQWCSHQESSR